jgi:hypothetical protein
MEVYGATGETGTVVVTKPDDPDWDAEPDPTMVEAPL